MRAKPSEVGELPYVVHITVFQLVVLEMLLLLFPARSRNRTFSLGKRAFYCARAVGNLIGTDRTGTEALGNDFYGVNIDEVSFSIISRDLVANANVIAFNGRAGVGISAGSKGISILRNSIFSNRGVGIDLGGNGRTPNDAGDTDTGPNNLQNFPLVTSAVTRGTTTTIKGRLDSTPSREFAVRFFSNPAADEGKRFIGQKGRNRRQRQHGHLHLQAHPGGPCGHTITATATDAPTNTDPGGNTSEFSAPREVTP